MNKSTIDAFRVVAYGRAGEAWQAGAISSSLANELSQLLNGGKVSKHARGIASVVANQVWAAEQYTGSAGRFRSAQNAADKLYSALVDVIERQGVRLADVFTRTNSIGPAAQEEFYWGQIELRVRALVEKAGLPPEYEGITAKRRIPQFLLTDLEHFLESGRTLKGEPVGADLRTTCTELTALIREQGKGRGVAEVLGKSPF